MASFAFVRHHGWRTQAAWTTTNNTMLSQGTLQRHYCLSSQRISHIYVYLNTKYLGFKHKVRWRHLVTKNNKDIPNHNKPDSKNCLKVFRMIVLCNFTI